MGLDTTSSSCVVCTGIKAADEDEDGDDEVDDEEATVAAAVLVAARSGRPLLDVPGADG